MPTKFTVEVAADQFDELCKPSQPLAAIAELVWNGLDAEATRVTITIDRTAIDRVDAVVVADDGHGMTHPEALRDFKTLGGSWKKGRKHSKNSLRTLHGKKGQGRFRAFALGENAEWTSVAEGLNGLERTRIAGSLANSEITITEPESIASGTTGTQVRMTQARDTAGALLNSDAIIWLISRFAAYLIRYTDVKIVYDNQILDPAALSSNDVKIDLDPALSAPHGAAQLRVIEWKSEIVNHISTMMLCDADGVVLHEVTDIPTAGRKLTAYLCWAGFQTHAHDVLIGEMAHAVLSPVIEAGRTALATYLDQRVAAERVGIVEEWKARKVYPYTNAAATSTEHMERQVFDLVATAAASAVPAEPKAARLSLGLIKNALEQSPGALHRVLREVLDLTPEQVADFDRLLRTTSLGNVIATTTKVVERMTFLDDLHRLIFESVSKTTIKERAHLHSMLEDGRTWIFGDEYSLAVSEKTLTKVIAAHIAKLGTPHPQLGPVIDATGSKARRIDLMLSRAAQGPKGLRHLVVELKRPGLKLTQKELNQITNYAVALAKDPSFKAPDVTWDFWLVADDYDEYVSDMTHQDNLPVGVAVQKHPYTVRVRRWAEIFEENRQRLHFYREHLDYQAEQDDTIQATLTKYLPKLAEAAPQVEPERKTA